MSELIQINQIMQEAEQIVPGMKPAPNQEEKLLDCVCERCGTVFSQMVIIYKVSDIRPKGAIWKPSRNCPSCKIRLETEAKATTEAAEKKRHAELVERVKERWWNTSGIPDFLQGKDFKSFDRRLQPKAFDRCKKYADEFFGDFSTGTGDYIGCSSLVLYSDTPGVGKTHLMIAIAHQLIDAWNGNHTPNYERIKFISGPGLVRRIRSTFHAGQEHETEEEVYGSITGCELLMLDDVGKEKSSDFTREVYWYLIDERCKNGEPVVISSRLPLEGANSLVQLMGTDTVDRLYGMCRGEVCILTGKSYRVANKTP